MSSLFVAASIASCASIVSCAPSNGGSFYAQKVGPILTERCASCHGAEKQKGKLRLDLPEAISKGGADGVVMVPWTPERSDLVRRVKLPLGDDDHMPPKDRPQPTAGEIAVLESWIAAGASFTERDVPMVSIGSPITPPVATTAMTPNVHLPPPDPQTIAALTKALVNVEKFDPATELVRIDFAANAPTWTDEDLEKALAPIASQVADLSLARTHAGARTLALAARMPNLESLDLRATGVGDQALASLRGHARIARLVLVQSKLTDASVPTLLALPALKRVHLWRSEISPAGIASLASQRPKLTVDAGDAPPPSALEVEPELKLSNTAPVPSAPGADAKPVAPTPLEPVNTICPVSGKRVDAKHTVVFEGRVIGFCCDKCPTEFQADPAKFRSKLPNPR